LAIIPVPIILFFGALALPLKKDQPMEVYLAAVISFMLKPKKRLWQPDGIERLVEVIAPKVEEKTYGNNYDQAEVQRRLSYLANLVDSQGWSIRGVNNPNSSMRADLFNEGQAANDILDENSATAQNINHLINQSDVRRRQEVIQKMQTGQSATPPPTQTPQSSQSDNPTPATPLQMNPYPTMRQSVLNPVSGRPAASAPAQTQSTTTPQTSVNEVSPAIIELANNRDLSIETIRWGLCNQSYKINNLISRFRKPMRLFLMSLSNHRGQLVRDQVQPRRLQIKPLRIRSKKDQLAPRIRYFSLKCAKI